jgi:hypothetical protein
MQVPETLRRRIADLNLSLSNAAQLLHFTLVVLHFAVTISNVKPMSFSLRMGRCELERVLKSIVGSLWEFCLGTCDG